MWQSLKSNACKVAVAGLTAATLTSMSSAATAASVDELPLSDELKQLILAAITAPATSPGIAQSSPVGFGAAWGDVFAGIGGVQTTKAERNSPTGKSLSGSASIGFGLGNPNDFVGLETTISIISLSGSGIDDSEVGEDGNVNFKLHRALSPTTSVAVGVENAIGWGAAENTDSSKYISLSHASSLRPNNPSNPMTVVVTAGVGDSRFKDQTEPAAQRNNDNAINPFAAVSLAFNRRASVIADWSGSSLGASVSFVPFKNIPLSATVGVIDVTDRLDDGARFTSGIGYSYNFGK
ncbi:MAG: hypothetical protein ACI91G_000469 [Gammaproteobacteria bacterium]|jgi:hypothetical protein